MECINYSFFRVTRDADLELKELEADDLLLAVEQSLQKRRLGGDVVRLEVESDMPENILKLLIESISIQKEYIYFCKSLLGLDDLNQLTKIDRDDLKENLLIGKTHPELKHLDLPSNKNLNSIFKILRKKIFCFIIPMTYLKLQLKNL